MYKLVKQKDKRIKDLVQEKCIKNKDKKILFLKKEYSI